MTDLKVGLDPKRQWLRPGIWSWHMVPGIYAWYGIRYASYKFSAYGHGIYSGTVMVRYGMKLRFNPKRIRLVQAIYGNGIWCVPGILQGLYVVMVSIS